VSEVGTVEDLFQIAITAENETEKLYREFSQKFSHHPEIAEFWENMRKGEVIHVRELQKIKDSIDESKLRLTADPLVYIEACDSLRLAQRAEMDSIRSLNDAYELAHELESSEINAVFKFLLTKFGTNNDTRKFIMYELEKHLTELSTFTDRFGDREWRKSIKVNELDSK